MLRNLLGHIRGRKYRPFINVANWPCLSDDDSKRFLGWVSRLDHALQGLIFASDAIPLLGAGKPVSIYELERYEAAVGAVRNNKFGIYSGQTEYDFALADRLHPILQKALAEAEATLRFIAYRDDLTSQLDVASRQIVIARWSAIASVASAIAAVVALVIALMHATKP